MVRVADRLRVETGIYELRLDSVWVAKGLTMLCWHLPEKYVLRQVVSLIPLTLLDFESRRPRPNEGNFSFPDAISSADSKW
jgi:hypothetical protein